MCKIFKQKSSHRNTGSIYMEIKTSFSMLWELYTRILQIRKYVYESNVWDAVFTKSSKAIN